MVPFSLYWRLQNEDEHISQWSSNETCVLSRCELFAICWLWSKLYSTQRGTVTETIVVVDKHPRFRLLSGSAVVIGSSRIHPSGVEDNMFKGSVAEFKIYSEVLSPSQIHEVMFQRSAPLAESAVVRVMFVVNTSIYQSPLEGIRSSSYICGAVAYVSL